MGSNIAFCVEERHGDTWRLVPGIEYDDRNYELFAMLCGARNRFGFEPLDDWRGWPEGVSDETRKRLYDEAGSWFALPEWLASDLTRTVTAAYIWSPSPGFRYFDGSSWCVIEDVPFGSGSSWSSIDSPPPERTDTAMHRQATEAARWISAWSASHDGDWAPGVTSLSQGTNAAYARLVSWPQSYASFLGRFDRTILDMCSRAVTHHDGDLSALRAVYGID